MNMKDTGVHEHKQQSRNYTQTFRIELEALSAEAPNSA